MGRTRGLTHLRPMPMFRVICGECGLAATHIRSGDRGVTSFDPDECVARCKAGIEAQAAGEPAVAHVLACKHLTIALQQHTGEHSFAPNIAVK
jgi:hypothetical protein